MSSLPKPGCAGFHLLVTNTNASTMFYCIEKYLSFEFNFTKFNWTIQRLSTMIDEHSKLQCEESSAGESISKLETKKSE